MNTALRFIALVMLAAILAACARETVEEPEAPEPPPPETPVEEPETERLDPRDFTDPRNLDNADSLLSERVIYFEFDRSNVRSQYRPIIEAHAEYLRANPSARVMLEGHADERGSREYNLGLGERRGNSVDELLRANNVPSRQLEVVSYGEERPVCRESNEDCWQRNRRVEIVYTAR
ncbi:MAG: peptidoglycan-associated lipoprotein Pal [Gammaproteobacteria bacterium]|jgi:peptidoglycan-associated lipoprotein|nr:peptidoglycan-associated lipoprotein Pal [Gammaproteobacteria bacterium]